MANDIQFTKFTKLKSSFATILCYTVHIYQGPEK